MFSVSSDFDRKVNGENTFQLSDWSKLFSVPRPIPESKRIEMYGRVWFFADCINEKREFTFANSLGVFSNLL